MALYVGSTCDLLAWFPFTKSSSPLALLNKYRTAGVVIGLGLLKGVRESCDLNKSAVQINSTIHNVPPPARLFVADPF